MKNPYKREAILEAARELIAELGFHGAPMAMIAYRAAVGVGTIYSHFESKDALIQELFLELRGKVVAVLLEGYSDDKPIRERFLHLGTGLLKYFITHPTHFRFIEQYMNSPYGVSYRRERSFGTTDEMDIFDSLFDQGIAQQVLKKFPIDVHFALYFGPLTSLARDHILGFIRLDDATIVKMIEACWDSIKR